MTEPRRATIAIAIIGAVGLILAFQGWQSRGPDADVIGSMVRAVALVDRGHIPQRGTLTDHNAFRPPGTSWLAIPGVVLFADPRPAELAGSGLLFLGTLPGLFLLGRHFFNDRVALTATGLYAFSSVALTLASQLWPRAHPFFCVWMIYGVARWVDRRDSRWLATALVVLAVGMYVHLEMTAMAVILPVVWRAYRPPVDVRWLGAAVALSLLIWSPYLLFQRDRRFMDLQSQLLLRPLESRGIETVEKCGDDPLPGPRFRARSLEWSALPKQLAIAPDLLLENLHSRVLAGELVLLGLLVGGLVAAGTIAPRPRGAGIKWPPLASGLVVIAVLATEFALRWIAEPGGTASALLLNARRLEVWLLAAAGVLWGVTGPPLWATGLRQSWRRRDARLLAIAVIAPAVILLLLTDINRLLGLMPFQVLLITAFADQRRSVLLPIVAAALLVNPVTLSRARDWAANGWAGAAPDRIEAIDYRSVRCPDEL